MCICVYLEICMHRLSHLIICLTLYGQLIRLHPCTYFTKICFQEKNIETFYMFYRNNFCRKRDISYVIQSQMVRNLQHYAWLNAICSNNCVDLLNAWRPINFGLLLCTQRYKKYRNKIKNTISTNIEAKRQTIVNTRKYAASEYYFGIIIYNLAFSINSNWPTIL